MSMALPKLDLPLYTTKLPSTDEEVTYRPFLVKEEKILLMALESGDDKEIFNATQQIIQNCVQNCDLDTISSFDAEWLFLQIRMKSIGETTTLRFRHKKNKNRSGEECKHITSITVGLEDVQVEGEVKPDVIMLSKEMGMKMKYPTMRQVMGVASKQKEGAGTQTIVETIVDIVADCIDVIFDGDTVYDAKKVTRKERVEFLENLNSEQFQLVEKFFRGIPKLKKDIRYTCDKCGESSEYTVEGLSNFFV